MSDLICRDLCMTFRDAQSGVEVEALKNINFELKEGEILAVLGPSGCGKTTLLNMIAGFLNPTSGDLTLGGVDIDGPGAERGMVFQQGALFEWLTVARNVDFGLRMSGAPEEETAEKVLSNPSRPVHPLRLCKEVRDFIDRDGILCVDGQEILNFLI